MRRARTNFLLALNEFSLISMRRLSNIYWASDVHSENPSRITRDRHVQGSMKAVSPLSPHLYTISAKMLLISLGSRSLNHDEQFDSMDPGDYVRSSASHSHRHRSYIRNVIYDPLSRPQGESRFHFVHTELNSASLSSSP